MDIRYSCNQRDFKRYTTAETRAEFLIEKLFAPDEVVKSCSRPTRSSPYTATWTEWSRWASCR